MKFLAKFQWLDIVEANCLIEAKTIAFGHWLNTRNEVTIGDLDVSDLDKEAKAQAYGRLFKDLPIIGIQLDDLCFILGVDDEDDSRIIRVPDEYGERYHRLEGAFATIVFCDEGNGWCSVPFWIEHLDVDSIPEILERIATKVQEGWSH